MANLKANRLYERLGFKYDDQLTEENPPYLRKSWRYVQIEAVRSSCVYGRFVAVGCYTVVVVVGLVGQVL